jgi:hypothetical protein
MMAAVAEAYKTETPEFAGFSYPSTGHFLCDLDDTLRRVRGVRLRLSLCRVDFPLGQETTLELAGAVDDPSLIAGYDACGRLLILFLGPRPDGARGDAVAFTTIMSKLRNVMSRDCGQMSAEGGRIVTVHSWSDVFSDARSILAELDQAAVIPLAAVMAHAA